LQLATNTKNKIAEYDIDDRDELGFVRLNRTCGHSTSAWCQLGNGLRIVNGGSGQWKRIRSTMGHALDDDDVTLHLVIVGLVKEEARY